MKHLWEVKHPYYGASGHEESYDSFEDLRIECEERDEDDNFLYRWDWTEDHREEENEARFTVFFVQLQREKLMSLSCPITRSQEAEVISFLLSSRAWGYLQKVWAPLLDEAKIDA